MVSVLPSISVTVSSTLKTPAVLNICVGLISVDVFPSPKSQKYDVIPTSSTELIPVKSTDKGVKPETLLASGTDIKSPSSPIIHVNDTSSEVPASVSVTVTTTS